jgi:hypothetical protein
MPNIRVNRKIGIPMLDRPVFDLKNINSVNNNQEEIKKMEGFEVVDSD